MLTTNKLISMEKEMNGDKCDSPFGLELEILDSDNKTIIQLFDTRKCKTYGKFMEDLILSFEAVIKSH